MQTREKLSKLVKRRFNHNNTIHSFNFQIGNYVLYDNKPIKIVSIYKHKIGFYNEKHELVFINSINVQPIEITKDILKRNNFKLDEYISENTNNDIYNLITYKNNKVSITFDNDYEDIFIYIDDDHRIGILTAYIKYIHQLQNLMNIIEDNINIKI
jgi:translation elongation factor P/translation initiation factor 5A